MASKLLLLPRQEYEPYLNVLPKAVSLPAEWSKDEVEQLQSEYMIQKVCKKKRRSCSLSK